MATTVVIKESGYSVTIEQEPASGVSWPEMLQSAITAVKGHYDYLNMVDIVDHINEEWGYLVERRDEEQGGERDGYIFVTDVNIEDDEDENNNEEGDNDEEKLYCDRVSHAEYVADKLRNSVGDEETKTDFDSGAAVCGTAD